MSNSLSALSKTLSSGSSNVSVNLPGLRLNASSQLFTAIPELGRTINETANRINKAVSDVMGYVNTAYCIGSALTDPKMLLGLLGSMANAAAAVAANIAKRMTDMIKNQITEALSVVSESVNDAIKSVKKYTDQLASFVKSIQDVLKALDNFSISIKVDAKANWDDFKIQEDCEYMFSMMAACLISKLIGNKLQELEKKVSDKIKKEGANLKDAISDAMSDVDNLSNYLEKEKFRLEKAEKQIKGISDIISGKTPSKVSVDNIKKVAKEAGAKGTLVDAKRAPIIGNTLSEIRDKIKNRNK